MENVDLLITGGHVIDPASGISKLMDVAVKDGIVFQVGERLNVSAERRIDAGGDYVVPGLIDMHCHIYPTAMYDDDCLPNVNGEAHMFQAGVTTAVDAGTCGWRDFMNFKEEIIDRAKLRILSFINIACGGMVTLHSEQTPADFHPMAAAGIVNTFPELVVGIKAAHYWGDKPFDEEHPPWASVDSGLEAASLCKKPLMVDFKPNEPLCSYRELVEKKMRPGDIHTHMYAQQFPILDEHGRVLDFMREARERGIHFDLGHGAGSFWFRNAVMALRDGFAPDTLSSDLYMGNVRGPVINLLHIMSKYLNMGMAIEEVVERVTVRSAKAVGHEELGTLKPGACADVAVIRKVNGNYGYADCGNAKINGSCRLECMMTVRAGEVVYNPYGLGMPDWETAPAAYWGAPGVL